MTFKSDYPTNWSGIVIPTELQNKIYEADYVFFVNCENDSSVRYLAYAGMAIFDEITKRPKMGLISWNMYFTDLNAPVIFNVKTVYTGSSADITRYEMNVTYYSDLEKNYLIHHLQIWAQLIFLMEDDVL